MPEKSIVEKSDSFKLLSFGDLAGPNSFSPLSFFERLRWKLKLNPFSLSEDFLRLRTMEKGCVDYLEFSKNSCILSK